ncbi:putative zinc finger BED domain-containing protein 4-like [Daphnia sinensis]|uniref:Zinc finger BED domain-containing protein 4-like n=1 Tax=Daphnia sinensis TaxID=1820382 RepID=A0AAD5PZ86_9CRUS|nr:putative zinc finger BED domain-containing protein 4-like [Daphnia sinensis]
MSNFHQEDDGIDSDSTVINESRDAATDYQPSTSRPRSSEQEPLSSSCATTTEEAIASLLPLSIIDDPNFVAFIKCIDARIEARLKLIHELERVDYVALTTDYWTSLNNYSYLTVTAHYINHKMKMVSRVLCTVHMENNHTADNLRDELFSIVDRWGVRNKIVGVVTDNAADIKKAVTDGCCWIRIPCFAHTLSLAFKGSIEKNDAVVQI